MSRFTSKQELLDEIIKERNKLEVLLSEIPAKRKAEVVIDGMSTKDFLAHRTEWGRMMIRWYETAEKGGTPDVPTKEYKWNQLKELNAEIFDTYQNTPLKTIENDFKKVNNKLFKIIENIPEGDLLTKGVYTFTGASDLATYFNSATASHYRSARRHIQKWWKQAK